MVVPSCRICLLKCLLIVLHRSAFDMCFCLLIGQVRVRASTIVFLDLTGFSSLKALILVKKLGYLQTDFKEFTYRYGLNVLEGGNLKKKTYSDLCLCEHFFSCRTRTDTYFL